MTPSVGLCSPPPMARVPLPLVSAGSTKPSLRARLAAACLLAAGLTSAPAGLAPAAAAAPDYSKGSSWICRPGRLDDACGSGVSVTAIAADGSARAYRIGPDRTASIDCFYVYPTVSRDPGVVADGSAGPEERRAALLQFAAFASVCRLFAPLYRQYTVTAMNADLAGRPLPGSADPALTESGYSDVRRAWRHYLATDNQGRGIVLVGHSQGSRVLSRLIAEEIEGSAVRPRIVSALVIGRTVELDRDGRPAAFRSMPLCRSDKETGCLIAYSSYRDSLGPSPGALFGKARTAGREGACTNPANLAGGGGTLKPLLSNGTEIIADAAAADMVWVEGRPRPRSQLVSLPGLLTAECVRQGGYAYLEISVRRSRGDRRRGIKGDRLKTGMADADWGLHLIDVNLALGNLIEIVRSQAAEYRRAADP